ncbi:hypothetical protein [Mesorhizobium sp. IMUNJ 23232]|uniref:hypothetical protein n=1 Tax=Mesorhizobium sp. IMUNJ 23232 TaxID=3376064 RepID=UPI0037AC8A54
MHAPTWIAPVLFGGGVGALALAIVGFTWGGWVTDRSAKLMVRDAAAAAVASSLTPYCMERSKTDPRSVEILADLKVARAFQRPGMVEQAGWATPLGQDKPNPELATACGLAIYTEYFMSGG